MTKIDFYHLCEESAGRVIPFAARLSEKITRMNHRIYLHATDQEMTRNISSALWATNPESFLPHCHIDSGEPVQTGIEIGYGEKPGTFHDVMINLDGKIPGFFSRFNRVVEILVNEEPMKTAARERYKFYKDRGYHVDYHEIALKQ